MQISTNLLDSLLMNRLPQSKVTPSPPVRDVPLVIKDGLRELRFITKQSAIRWIEGVEDVLTNIPKFGSPLGAATKTASQLLQFADHAAVVLLSTENSFRRADFRLSPPDFYVTSQDDASRSKTFIKNYYWALKHLLKLKGKNDFLVSEESIFQAFKYFEYIYLKGKSTLSPDQPHQAKSSESSLLSACIIYALYRSKPLSHHDTASQDPENLAESTATLTLHACASAVLASDMTSFFPNASARLETLSALKLGDEVCGARLESWERAILHRQPIQQLAREIDFTLRYL